MKNSTAFVPVVAAALALTLAGCGSVAADKKPSASPSDAAAWKPLEGAPTPGTPSGDWEIGKGYPMKGVAYTDWQYLRQADVVDGVSDSVVKIEFTDFHLADPKTLDASATKFLNSMKAAKSDKEASRLMLANIVQATGSASDTFSKPTVATLPKSLGGFTVMTTTGNVETTGEGKTVAQRVVLDITCNAKKVQCLRVDADTVPGADTKQFLNDFSENMTIAYK